jgi:golgin subfamily A member 2
MNQFQFKEQLQLHVQTIGILVAEKAELQSKLQQQSKKVDKKQEECDELTGRLKASRQKISDLERLVNQLNETSESTRNLDNNNDESASMSQLEQLRHELNSNQLIVDELRMRLAESDDRVRVKHQESQQLAQLTYDLKSQLEIMQLKMLQMNEANRGEESESVNVASSQLNVTEDKLEEVLKLRQLNESLEKKLLDANGKIESLQENLKGEYQTYVDQLRKQVESLVDQINRMSDEREDSFSKIDRLDVLLKNANSANQELTNEMNRMKKQLEESGDGGGGVEAINLNKNELGGEMMQTQNKSLQKYELLENEIKYFKHQIELLLFEESSLRQVLYYSLIFTSIF